MYINFNGRLYKQKECAHALDNRGLKYGDGLFETIRVFEGKMPFLPFHFKRLTAGMKVLQMEVPKHFTLKFLKKEIRKIIMSKENARIRITVFRDGGGKYAPIENGIHYFIERELLYSAAFELNGKGWQVNFFEDCTVHHSKISPFKTCNSLPYILGSLFYKKNKLDDALILNPYFRVAESTHSNIFIVKKKKVITPPLTEGCVNGSMRSTIIGLCKKEKISLKEKPIIPDMIWEADEVFLTNASNGIRWVERIGEQVYTKKKMAKRLLKLLNEIVAKS